ncbi:MAG TPA: winged helix-turn-helix transcriptional regulator [Candidatus Thermoplasmatota archaeon]|nr:winged helix-turn-helix transcriptional regulator [Candidatus Thermoplasmatota archaeon]
MSRPIAALVLLTLLAPVALAAGEADDVASPAVPDLTPVAAGIGAGVATAASATGDALASAGHGALAIAAGIGRALGAAATALGHAIAALASALGLALIALGHLLSGLASAIGAALGIGARYVAAHPKESAIVAGSASGASLLAYSLRKLWPSLLLPLYSRLAKSDMLGNKVRASVFEHVKANPGAHPSAIAETLGLGWGTVVYHLARLEESSLLTTRTAHNRKCYFVVGGELSQEERTAVAAMATDKARLIVDALRATPGVSQKTLAEQLGMSQALASWHVKRLIQSGVLVSVRDGRSNLLHVAGHVPVLAQPIVAPALAA